MAPYDRGWSRFSRNERLQLGLPVQISVSSLTGRCIEEDEKFDQLHSLFWKHPLYLVVASTDVAALTFIYHDFKHGTVINVVVKDDVGCRIANSSLKIWRQINPIVPFKGSMALLLVIAVSYTHLRAHET